MLRDNLVGLIEPMLSGAGAYPLALRNNRKPSSDDSPACLENPRPAGAESTLTENVASPFHAEPGQNRFDGETRKADLDSVRGKADDVEEETGRCTPRDRRDRGPGTQGRIRRDNVCKVPPAAL